MKDMEMTDEECCLVTSDWGRGKAEPTSDSLWVAAMLKVLADVKSHQNLLYL